MARLFDPMKKNGKFPFKWVPPAQTDVAATFRRVRAEQAKNDTEAEAKVKQLKRIKA